MLQISAHGKISERKLRLVALTCTRRVVHLLRLDGCRKVLDEVEQCTDEPLAKRRLTLAHRKLWKARAGYQLSHREDAAATAIAHCCQTGVAKFAEWAIQNAFDALALAGYTATLGSQPNYQELRANAREAVLPYWADLVRDILGNPFQSVSVIPVWLAWNDGALAKIAQAIYDERAFDRMPILADALEDAGCGNVDILRHCREPGEHVRGCWVIDLLLGKT